jgi:undecaprenyl-diphosphatase
MLLSTLLKMGFDRPRPDLVPHGALVYTASFPSGHATLSAVVYLTLGALLARVQPRLVLKLYLLGLAILLTVMVGVSRVYLGVHWPTDVLAGWAVGAAWALLCWATALWLQRRGRVEGPGPAPDTAPPEPGER